MHIATTSRRRVGWLAVVGTAYLGLVVGRPSGWTAVGLSLLMAVLALGAYRRTRVEPLQKPLRWRRAVALLFLGYAVLFTGRLALLAVIAWAWPGLPSENLPYHVLRTFNLPLLLVVVVSTPVIEESLFRGMLFDLAPGRNAVYGVAFTSVVFAAMHWLTLGDAAVIGPAWWLGAVLAVLRAVTGRIELPIALHALNNLIGEVVGLT
jgi:membrane protease YdiL (CAAX protease family)